MESQYTILWFEDDDRFVKPYLERIRKYLKDFEFDLDEKVEENADNLEQLLKDDEFDLILVDLNLTEGKDGRVPGDVIIEKIRDNDVYTDVIFYSRVEGFRDKEYELEGTYFSDCNGDSLFQTTKQIIDKNLKRNLRIPITRGMCIADTIDLVEQIEDLISKILKLTNEELTFFQDSIIRSEFFNDDAKYTIIKDFLNGRIELVNKKKETANKGEKAALEERLKELEDIKKLFNRFKPDVIEIRNQLAHAKIVSGEKNTLRVRNKEKRSYENVKFDMEKCKKIRKDFVDQAENLKKIVSLLASDQ